jgi:ATP-dependent Clp protease adaptor protein ClpS
VCVILSARHDAAKHFCYFLLAPWPFDAIFGIVMKPMQTLSPTAPMRPVSFGTGRIQPHGSDKNGSESGNGDRGGRDDDIEFGIATKTKPKTKKPNMYKVLMLNDDYTPMEFVVHVLKRFFSMDTDEATRVMLAVHQRGVGICGVFSYEVAETKVNQVMDFAKQNQHPLQCTLEKD